MATKTASRKKSAKNTEEIVENNTIETVVSTETEIPVEDAYFEAEKEAIQEGIEAAKEPVVTENPDSTEEIQKTEDEKLLDEAEQVLTESKETLDAKLEAKPEEAEKIITEEIKKVEDIQRRIRQRPENFTSFWNGVSYN